MKTIIEVTIHRTETRRPEADPWPEPDHRPRLPWTIKYRAQRA